MLRCTISKTTQQKVIVLLYMTASGSLFNMFLLRLKRGKALSFFQLIRSLMTRDTKNARNKIITSIVLAYAVYIVTLWKSLNVPREVISEAACTVNDHTVTYLPCRKKKTWLEQLTAGVYDWLIKVSEVVKRTFCAHSDYDMAPCLQWGCGGHYLDNYCSFRRWKLSTTLFCDHCLWSSGLPIYSGALVSSLPVHHPSNPITVCDSLLSTVGRKKVHK